MINNNNFRTERTRSEQRLFYRTRPFVSSYYHTHSHTLSANDLLPVSTREAHYYVRRKIRMSPRIYRLYLSASGASKNVQSKMSRDPSRLVISSRRSAIIHTYRYTRAPLISSPRARGPVFIFSLFANRDAIDGRSCHFATPLLSDSR